jgi:hypothetical protein
LDETSGVGATGTISAGAPLRGLIPAVADAQAASGVPVTVLTEFARTMLPSSGFSAASAVAAITDAASGVIGVASYSQAMLPPVFNAQGQTSDQVTLKLAALAHVINQQGSGANLSAKLQNIATQLAAGSAVNAVIPQTAFNNALGVVNGGASSLLPVGVTPPTIPAFALPGGSLGNANSGGGSGSSGGGGVTASPVITGINPSTGPVGTALDIRGTNLDKFNGANLNNFAPAPTVKFGTTSATVTSNSYLGGVLITVHVPSGLSAGNHTITVSNGDGSGSVTAGTFNVVGTTTTPPIGLTPTVLSFSQISLTWTAKANSTYNIYRSTTPNFTPSNTNLIGGYSGLAIILGALGQGPYVDKNLAAGTTYYYKITEILTGGSESQPSTEVSATTNTLSGLVGVDWIVSPLGSGAATNGVAWSGTQYVAVDMLGNAHVSTDAITWSSYSTGATQPLIDIAWSGTQFVAVGAKGTIVTSPDGLVWTVRNSGLISYLYAVTWSGTQFVAVGGDSIVLTSADGITWSLRNSGLNVLVSLNSVTWSGSRFVAVGSGGHIITSTDGVFWGNVPTYTTNNLQGVVWNGSKFIVVGAGSLALSSADGSSWSQTAIGNSTTLNCLIWTGQQFIAAGIGGTILRSPDGVTWTPAASNTNQALYSISGSGSTYVIIGGGVALKSL